MRPLAAAAIALAALALIGVGRADERVVEVRLDARNATSPPRPALFLPVDKVVELDEPGWWSPRELPPSNRIVPVWRMGIVSGRITLAEENAKLPASIDVIVEAPPPPAKQPEIRRGTKFLCPVAADGKWSCALPGATLDLVLRAGAFIPVYRWQVKVPPGGARDLGTIAMKKGSSVFAWLDPSTRDALREPARAKLVRMLPPGAASETVARLSIPIAEGTFSGRGAVQLAPVPEGSYVLEVTAKGFAPARAFPIDVYPSRETVLRRAVTLELPLTFSVDIDPPLDPAGRRWQLWLTRLSDFSSGMDGGVSPRFGATETGQVRAAGQIPGRYIVTIQDAEGSSYLAEEWRIEDEESARRRVHLPLVHVRGTIRDGESPLPATLWFGGRHGAVRVKMRSSDEGKFQGMLPRRGTWRVEAESAVHPVPTHVDVIVDDQEIDIELPQTRLAGSVVDSAGKRVAGAVLTMLIAPAPLIARTDAQGNFSFRGFPRQAFTLIARDARGYETTRTAQFSAEPPLREGVEVRLEPTRTIGGRILSRRGAVVGAAVTAYPTPPGGETGRAVSDVEGRFDVRLPAATTRASFVVAAPGHALQVFDLPIGEEPVLLDLAVDGGTLRIELPQPSGILRVTHNGLIVPRHELFRWAEAHGESLRAGVPLRIPNLAPGAIRACVAAGPCAEGQLAAGGTLELDLRR